MGKKEIDLLGDLTPAQREAVTHTEGPLLVLAAAGSGKTRVITRRVAYLLQQGVHPGNILAITFTNKAAGEMKRRVEALVPWCRVLITTFHKLGARILRQYGERLDLDRNFTIYDQTDRAKLIKMAFEDAGVNNVRYTPESIGAAISKAKNQLLSPERYAQNATDFYTQVVAEVYPVYERMLRDANALDFDDLLYWPALALKHDRELREELDSRFRYLMIDEYQDTNHAQYSLARSLSVDYPNICVVGDPDQSIYAFRGADIRNILDFERDFPDARVLPLSLNYRSTRSILHAADTLIQHNKRRKHKDLTTDNDQGPPVTVRTFSTGNEEAEEIARQIRASVEAGRRRYRDHAIFVRVNALSRAFETAFVRERVPFQIVRGLAFFERKENRDVLAYLRLITNPKDDISFLRVINEPARGIGKVSLEHLKAYAERRELSLLEAAWEVDRIAEIKGKATKGIRDFTQTISDLMKIRDAQPAHLISETLDKTGYRKMLRDSRDPDDQERLANIEELITAASQFTKEDPNSTIGDFLENITLASDIDGWNDQQDTVSIMTLHAAKGLEFPVVFIVAMEQGILPHERSLNRVNEIEEERRLAFVGMTRAMQELYITRAHMREFRGQTLYTVPSMFLSEIPTESVETHGDPDAGSVPAFDHWRTGGHAAAEGWTDAGIRPIPLPIPPRPMDREDGPYKVGVNVRHPNYGEGKVVELVGSGALRKVKIRFRTAGEKTFMLNKVKLELL